MVRENENQCPICGGVLRPYGFAKRFIRAKYGIRKQLYIKRYRCSFCNSTHNELPACVIPYIRYESDIVFGVLEGFITSNTLGFEDYPSEQTMHRWTHNLQLL